MTRPLHRRLLSACRSALADRGGISYILMGLAVVPLVGAAGIATDSARGYAVKLRLQDAIDAASLAAAAPAEKSDAQRQADLEEFFWANFPRSYMDAIVQGPTITSAPSPSGAGKIFTVTASAALPTTFMRVLGLNTLDVGARAVVDRSIRGLELALVLDNTGSMATDVNNGPRSDSDPMQKMNILKQAARSLVGMLYGTDENGQPNQTLPGLYVGLVPFTATVDVGWWNESWLQSVNNRATGQAHSWTCSPDNVYYPTWGDGSIPYIADNNTYYVGDLVRPDATAQAFMPAGIYRARVMHKVVYASLMTNGSPDPAKIAAERALWDGPLVCDQRLRYWADPARPVAGNVVPNYYNAGGATAEDRVQAGWQGCVEEREWTITSGGSTVTGDVSDAPPVDRNTWFNPYYWPNGLDNNSWSWKYTAATNAADPGMQFTGLTPAKSSQDGGYRGPNKDCPQAITPLVTQRSIIENAISGMAYGGSTISNTGMAWGWRALSPQWRGRWYNGHPRVPAASYQAALPLDYAPAQRDKAVILLTDGLTNFPEGGYSAYGTLANARLGASDSAAEQEINARLGRVCTAMKNQGIIVFTITFGINDPGLDTLYRDCASEHPITHDGKLYFKSETGRDLQDAFEQIGFLLTNLRLAE